jgi:hypothetical protein
LAGILDQGHFAIRREPVVKPAEYLVLHSANDFQAFRPFAGKLAGRFTAFEVVVLARQFQVVFGATEREFVYRKHLQKRVAAV